MSDEVDLPRWVICRYVVVKDGKVHRFETLLDPPRILAYPRNGKARSGGNQNGLDAMGSRSSVGQERFPAKFRSWVRIPPGAPQ